MLDRVPCKHFFGPTQCCPHGADCFFSHSLAVYMKWHGLRRCPNPGCTALCRGLQCSECHSRYVASVRAGEPKLCAAGCGTVSRHRWCRGCAVRLGLIYRKQHLEEEDDGPVDKSITGSSRGSGSGSTLCTMANKS